MKKQLIAALAMALIVGVFHYAPPVGPAIEKAQRDVGKNRECPPGTRWNQDKRMCE